MGGYTFDYPLFLWLNFDGGVIMDNLMLAASKPAAWAWLYILILYMVWRRDGWRGVALFVVAAAVAIVLGDMIAGIFKHTGMLKNLWAEFPARLRPMYTPELEGMVSNILRKGGQYGTVSAHAATSMSIFWVIGLGAMRGVRCYWPWMAAWVVAVGYSRIYLGVHFPSQILFGWLLGTLVGLFLAWVLHRVKWVRNLAEPKCA